MIIDMDIKEVIEQVEESAQNNIEDIRFIKKISVGQVVRQGDVYIHCVENNHPMGHPCLNQLAEGTSKGSRHIAERPATTYTGIQGPSWAGRCPLGPVIVSEDRFTITHPEHAHISLPAGTYQTTHQMDPRTLRRVED